MLTSSANVAELGVPGPQLAVAGHDIVHRSSINAAKRDVAALYQNTLMVRERGRF
jgi:hypothetical protein